MAFLQRVIETYISTAPESAINTPVTTGANFKRVLVNNPRVTIPQPLKRDNQGRGGSEFITAPPCNTYWENPQIEVAGPVDFDMMSRLWLRAVGGTITDTTVVATFAFKHSAPMLPGSTSLVLPASTGISRLPGSVLSYLYSGMIVGQASLSQNRVDAAEASFTLTGTGKHKTVLSPADDALINALPAISSWSCVRPFAYLSYDNGAPVDLGAGCGIRNWSVSLNNNLNPEGDRCTSDPLQNAGDYSTSGGASEAAYNTTLTHGDRNLDIEFNLLVEPTSPQYADLVANTPLTSVTFGARGALLNGSTYESIKLIVPIAYFMTVVQADSEGKASIGYRLKPQGTTSVLTVEVVNGTSGTFS